MISTNLSALAQRRARRLAILESLAGWADSLDSDERLIYARAKRSYEAAELKYRNAAQEAEDAGPLSTVRE